MLKRFSVLLLLFLFCVFSSYSQENDVQTLSLEEFLSRASSHDQAFALLLLDKMALSYNRAQALSANNFILGASAQYNLNFQDLDTPGFQGSLSLKKLFPQAGSSLGLGYSTAYSSSSVSVSYEQDIIKNAFGKTERYKKELAGVEEELGIFQLLQAHEDYFASLIKLWLDWQLAYQSQLQAEKSLAEYRKLLVDVRERARNFIANQTDIDRITLQVLEKEESLEQSRSAFKRKSLDIASRCGLPFSAVLLPSMDSRFSPSGWEDLPEDRESLTGTTRTGRICQLLFRQSGIDVSMAKEDLLPSVSFSAEYTLSGSGYSFDDPENALSLGFSLDYPLPGKREKAAYQEAVLGLERETVSLDQTLDTLLKDLYLLHNQIIEQDLLVESSRKRLELTEKIYRARLTDYTKGNATLNELIQDQNTLQSLRFLTMSRDIQRQGLLLEWYRLTDQLITDEVQAPSSRK